MRNKHKYIKESHVNDVIDQKWIKDIEIFFYVLQAYFLPLCDLQKIKSHFLLHDVLLVLHRELSGKEFRPTSSKSSDVADTLCRSTETRMPHETILMKFGRKLRNKLNLCKPRFCHHVLKSFLLKKHPFF